MGEKVFQDLDRAGWRVGDSDAGCLNTPNTVVQTGEQRARLFEYGLISRGLVEPRESRARPVCAAVRGKPRRGRVMHPASEPPTCQPCSETNALAKNLMLQKTLAWQKQRGIPQETSLAQADSFTAKFAKRSM